MPEFIIYFKIDGELKIEADKESEAKEKIESMSFDSITQKMAYSEDYFLEIEHIEKS